MGPAAIILCVQATILDQPWADGLTVDMNTNFALSIGESHMDPSIPVSGGLGFRMVGQTTAIEPLASIGHVTWTRNEVPFRSWKDETVFEILVGVRAETLLDRHFVAWFSIQVGAAHFSQTGGDCSMTDAECQAGYSFDVAAAGGLDILLSRHLWVGPFGSLGGGPISSVGMGMDVGAVF